LRIVIRRNCHVSFRHVKAERLVCGVHRGHLSANCIQPVLHEARRYREYDDHALWESNTEIFHPSQREVLTGDGE
jgi:hypothetical protein